MPELKPAGTRSVNNTSKPLIYLVDDEPMLLELAAAILEPQGYVVKAFRDPEVALKTYMSANPRPSLLVTDYAMHTMNGMELIERFRQLNPSQRVLLISGTVAEDIFENSPIKPDRFLAKPYQAPQLSDAVKELIEAK